MTLAKRAVACKGWRWLPGMLTLDQWRINTVYSDGDVEWISDCGQVETIRAGPAVPALDDPATLGCLLALVREAWGPLVWWEPNHEGDGEGELYVYKGGECVLCYPGTEAATLVAALEAAP